MRVLHALIAMVFTVVGLSCLTKYGKVTPGLLSLLIANVSLAVLAIENALDKSPVEIPNEEGEGSS
ncbi:hypothetical protein MK489_22200 [Myxococcota bacterium]|nr:hypothetical protein [Myxococcota bacterium]